MTRINYKTKEEALAAFKRAMEKKRAWMEAAEREFSNKQIQSAV